MTTFLDVFLAYQRRVLHVVFCCLDAWFSWRFCLPFQACWTSSALWRPGFDFYWPLFYLSPPIKYLSQRWSKIRSLCRHLTVEEQNLFSVAYRNIISARRALWRVVLSIEQREQSKGNKAQISMIHIKDYWPGSLWCESLKSRVKWQVNPWHSQFAPLICFRGIQGVLLQNVSEF